MRGLDLPTLVIAHAWVLIAFTILIGALAHIVREKAPRYWFYSDVLGLLSLLGIYLTLTRSDQLSMMLFASTTYLTLHFRVMALASDDFGRHFRRVSSIVLAALVPFNVLLGPSVLVAKTIINSIAFIVLSSCMIYALFYKNDVQNRLARILIVAAALAYIVVAILRTFNIFGISLLAADHVNSFNTLLLTILMLLGIFAHIGFIIIVLERLNRAELRTAEALAREAERRENAEEREKETLALAEEQSRLIEVLTHEVRQPLNNASAALQSISNALVEEQDQSRKSNILRAQSVIDQVGMALSNALVEATILERQQKFDPVRYDPMLLVEMVKMDFNDEQRRRIELDTDGAPLYISADPVLLRIALRNLLDNALRYSPTGSIVTLQLSENEADMGAEFRVINSEPIALDLAAIDVFGRRIRGRVADIDGSGMGLYITSEITKLHQGWIKTWNENGLRIFTLFIQD